MRVCVVMSTYNGEAHLKEQLNSILSQTLPIDIFIRDDGSRDGTWDIVSEYACHHGCIKAIRGDNLGCTASFLTALRLAGDSYDYYAFSDQDDVWHPDKMERAVSALERRDGSLPLLYCSNYNFCDGNLAFQSKSDLAPREITFPDTLYENVCSGNTMVFNACLRELALKVEVDAAYCHDWWLALVATAMGDIFFDQESSLEYRRTGDNVSPTGESFLKVLGFRIKAFLTGNELGKIKRQLIEFEKAYGPSLDEGKGALLHRCVAGNRVARATVPVRLRQKNVDEFALRTLMLLGRL